ncbi:hypothetical protein RYX36_030493 [Vicia faba]
MDEAEDDGENSSGPWYYLWKKEISYGKTAGKNVLMYAEIDPEFVRNYSEELNKTWTVMNNQCVHQEMIFNKVRMNPMIISGWPLLEAYYDPLCDVVIEVGYYGDNNFGINWFKELSKWEDLPHFHSKYIFNDNIHAFDLILSPISASVLKLVEYW